MVSVRVKFVSQSKTSRPLSNLKWKVNAVSRARTDDFRQWIKKSSRRRHPQICCQPNLNLYSLETLFPTMTNEASPPNLTQLPPEMLEFALLKTSGALAPRLGRLTLPGRKTILTPGFLGNTSRGAVPHISQDNFRSVSINGVYVALEDCACSRFESTKTRLTRR